MEGRTNLGVWLGQIIVDAGDKLGERALAVGSRAWSKRRLLCPQGGSVGARGPNPGSREAVF